MNKPDLTNELLPCPFCGGEARRYIHKNDKGDNFLQWKTDNWVSCIGCGNQTCMHGEYLDAIAAWNQRYNTSEYPVGEIKE